MSKIEERRRGEGEKEGKGKETHPKPSNHYRQQEAHEVPPEGLGFGAEGFCANEVSMRYGGARGKRGKEGRGGGNGTERTLPLKRPRDPQRGGEVLSGARPACAPCFFFLRPVEVGILISRVEVEVGVGGGGVREGVRAGGVL
jgi:hypothetical protein